MLCPAGQSPGAKAEKSRSLRVQDVGHPFRAGVVRARSGEKNHPCSSPPLERVSSASARRFSTRNSDIQPDIGRKAGRLDILMRMGFTPTEFIWFNGKLIPWGEAKVHVLAHGLQCGTGVVRRHEVLPDVRRSGDLPPRRAPRALLQVGGAVRPRHPIFTGDVDRREPRSRARRTSSRRHACGRWPFSTRPR